ncbi:50S ribosome-binding GTPase [Pseudanabaena sp. FACHB-1277]|uniref:50S ribosome-binding GTPase n=1 Tax=Pseudanabaena cinerea FACHB-1277 TaxID=2949581 RepID=A0A926UX18_9CYAN|nr:GTPase [Pseudanabaena cinerea]MBD2152715.1 50S ribosome-binding GTPase [Pseudanabaena cinerea FACHB-1277]
MATFSYKDRNYTASFSVNANNQQILVITNPEKVELHIKNGNRKATRKDLQGNNREIDLEEPQRKDFYDGLIEEARKVAEKEENDRNAESVFNQQVDTEYAGQVQDFNKTLNIAVVGNVSSGKSSLINAILMRKREDAVADVGATSGVTTELNILRLNDERVRLIDSPGLGDIRKENSAVTKEFLKHIDIGILVVTGSADASQKQYFDDLRANCTRVFLVLNKCDQWDNYRPQALEDVKEQWKQCLGVDKIYAVCALGYDKQLPDDFPLDIRGVNELREDVDVFLDSEGKKLLFARHMGDKKPYAKGIIIAAVSAVGIQAIFPGRAAFITATQVGAIVSLYYLYTGNILSKGTALALLPVFIGQSVATNLFLWVSSILPPTGVVEVSAAITATSITYAMLAAVDFVLFSGLDLTEKDILKNKYNEYKNLLGSILRRLGMTDVRNLGSLNFKDIIDGLF